MSRPDRSTALAELRNARKRVRTANIDWIDAMYRAYILTIVGVIAVLVASGYVGDADVTAQGVTDVRDLGPSIIGIVAAVGVAIGLRSGSRGGPLALEAADVRHVLLAPIDRGQALRAAAMRQLRHTLLAALAFGAVGGQLAARRLPGNPAAWTACGALVGGAAVIGAFGAGYLAAGRRLSTRVCNAAAVGLLGWSAADIANRSITSPLSMLGAVTAWPLTVRLLGIGGVVAMVALGVVGIASIGGLSIELAERRSALIGRLAFAATLQDLRTVMVLRRQLAQEHSRTHPWSRYVPWASRWPVWGRAWRGILRWPPARLARVFMLGAAAGASAIGMVRGTTPLIVIAGAAMYIAALDSVESLAQEIDHPSRTESFPIEKGDLQVRHLPAAFVVMILVALVGLATACALRPETSTLAIGALVVLPAAAGAVAGAAIGIVAGAPDPLSSWALGAPEIAGLHTIMRLLWPPALAIGGFVPVVAAVRAFDHHGVVLSTAATAAGLLLVLDAGIAAWIHARDDVLANIKQSFDVMGKNK